MLQILLKKSEVRKLKEEVSSWETEVMEEMCQFASPTIFALTTVRLSNSYNGVFNVFFYKNNTNRQIHFGN